MGFLKNFFTNTPKENAPGKSSSSFERLTEEQLESHLRIVKYANFLLTDAIRPAFDLKVVPKQGYRHDSYHDAETDTPIPVLMCSVTRERLFEVFMDMLEPFGNVVDVVLESSHDKQQGGHKDLYREHIDMPVLKSILWNYEELITHDGCTGLAIINPTVPQEIQFDEHKLLIVYGSELYPFEQVLDYHAVDKDESMKFITEAEHVHSSSDRYQRLFEELKTELGMDENY
jgi:hypothetical protein